MPEPSMPSSTIAPWVMQHVRDDGVVLLGPCWGAYALSEPLDAEALDADRRAELIAARIVVPEVPPQLEEEPAAAEPGLARALAVVGDDAALVHAMTAALREHGVHVVPPPRHAEPGPRAAVLVVAADEGTSPRERVAPWLPVADVLWLGEAHEGLHCGPWLRDEHDVASYERALEDTAWLQLLAEQALPLRWPTSLPWLLAHRPRALVAAIAAMLTRPDHDCVLVEGLRPVDLWVALERRPVAHARLLGHQRWSKGALRRLEVERLGQWDVYVAHASSPCACEPQLSDNFGKGRTPEAALQVAVGETVERLAAWFANRIPELAPSEHPPRCYDLADFHPNGPAWVEHLRRGAPPVPLRLAHDAHDGAPVGVPSFLVPFPFTDRRDPLLYALDGHTSGLAAHPVRTGAVLRGALELLERHDLYPRLRHEAPATLVPAQWFRDACPQAPVTSLVSGLAREGALALYVIHYASAPALPVAHAFLHDRRGGFVCRGSGSGLDFAAAAERAVHECLLGLREARGLDATTAPTSGHQQRFREWARPAVVERLLAYLRAQPSGPGPDVAFDDEPALLGHVAATLHDQGSALLVVELPCPVEGWTAVRVLAPGLTTHQIPSDSAGGRRLLGASFTHAIPT